MYFIIIAGYVIKEILPVFTCEKCIKAVIDDSNVHDHTYCTIENESFKTLTRMKNQRRLRISIGKCFQSKSLTYSQSVVSDKLQ